jgi:hypothetical protein
MTTSYPAHLTVPISAITFPGAGTGRNLTRHPLTSGLLLIVSRPGTPAPGHGSQPAPPRWPEDRSGMWLRNATAGLCVLAAAAATVSFTAFGALRYQNCLNAFRAGAGRGLAVSGLAGCGG